MPKHAFFTACLLLAALSASAQTNHLKLYFGFELANRPVLDYDKIFEQSNSLYTTSYATQPFYALAFTRENAQGSFWEISGQTNAYFGYSPVYGRVDSLLFPWPEIGQERNNYAQLQFEYNWLQGAGQSQKVRTCVGLFLRAAGQWAKFKPSSSAYFPQETWKVVLAPGFVPRLQIQTGKRWRLDLSTPIVLGYFGMEGSRLENPLLTREQQRLANFDLSMLNLDTQLRLGISYALSKPVAQQPE